MFANRLAVPEGRIVGGYSATPHSHPYIVSLQMRFLWVRAHFCGGSLLNKNWVSYLLIYKTLCCAVWS